MPIINNDPNDNHQAYRIHHYRPFLFSFFFLSSRQKGMPLFYTRYFVAKYWKFYQFEHTENSKAYISFVKKKEKEKNYSVTSRFKSLLGSSK